MKNLDCESSIPLSIKKRRESNLKNTLKFILADQTIELLYISFPYVLKNLNRVLTRYCQLALDGENFYNSDAKGIDAWVELPNKGKFVIKFPIPNELYSEDVFNHSRWSGNGSILGFGEEVIMDYFFPYLIRYVSQNYDNLTEEDKAILLNPYDWDFGPS